MSETRIATQTIHVATKSGIVRTIFAGQALPADDPIVKRSPDAFKTAEELSADVEVRHGPTVEQATAAPGEKRSVPTRPRK